MVKAISAAIFILVTISLLPCVAIETKISENEEGLAYSKVIGNQLKEIREGDIESAYRNYTAKEFRSITSYDDFDKFIRNFKVISNNQSFKIDRFANSNSIVTLYVTITGNDETLNAEYDLVQEDNQWKVLGIQVMPILP